jgi:hypothetical protein
VWKAATLQIDIANAAISFRLVMLRREAKICQRFCVIVRNTLAEIINIA